MQNTCMCSTIKCECLLFFLFVFSVCLDVPHLTNERRTHHCLEAHTTLNIYNLWKLALRGHLETDARTSLEGIRYN